MNDDIKLPEPVAVSSKCSNAFWVKWQPCAKSLRGHGIKLFTEEQVRASVLADRERRAAENLRQAIEAKDQIKLAAMFPIKQSGCWCVACHDKHNPSGCRSHMIVCPECGDKRCPRAEDHNNACAARAAVGE